MKEVSNLMDNYLQKVKTKVDQQELDLEKLKTTVQHHGKRIKKLEEERLPDLLNDIKQRMVLQLIREVLTPINLENKTTLNEIIKDQRR